MAIGKMSTDGNLTTEEMFGLIVQHLVNLIFEIELANQLSSHTTEEKYEKFPADESKNRSNPTLLAL